jgi:hypothetical protein
VIVRCDPQKFDGGASILLLTMTVAGTRELLLFMKRADEEPEEADEKSEEESEEEASEEDEEEEDPKSTDSIESAEEGDDPIQHELRIFPGSIYLATMCSAEHQVSVGHPPGRNKSTSHVCSNTAGPRGEGSGATAGGEPHCPAVTE